MLVNAKDADKAAPIHYCYQHISAPCCCPHLPRRASMAGDKKRRPDWLLSTRSSTRSSTWSRAFIIGAAPPPVMLPTACPAVTSAALSAAWPTATQQGWSGHVFRALLTHVTAWQHARMPLQLSSAKASTSVEQNPACCGECRCASSAVQ